MNLENNKNSPPLEGLGEAEQYKTEQEQAIYLSGYLGFGIDYLIHCVQLNKKEIEKQFAEENGNEYKIWLHGYYVAQTELRKTIMDSALNSSTPNIEKMLTYFAETTNELKNLEI